MNPPYVLALHEYVEASVRLRQFDLCYGDPLGAVETLKELLATLEGHLQADDAFRARHIKAEREKAEFEAAEAAKAYIPMSSAVAQRLILDRNEEAKSGAPLMRPWEDIQVSVREKGA